MYTKCVYTVPVTVVGIAFPLIKISYSSYMRNGVYKMCVHRSSNCGRYRISFKISYSSYMRNDVYKMFETVPLTVVGTEFPLK